MAVDKAATNYVIHDSVIRHGVYLDQLATGEVRQMIGFFNSQLEPDLVRKISRVTGEWSKTKALAIQKEVKNTVRTAFRTMYVRSEKTRKKLAGVEAKYNLEAIQSAAPLKLYLAGLDAQTLAEMIRNQPVFGRFVKDYWKGVAEQTITQVNQQIMIGAVQGEGIDKIVRRIRGTRAAKYKDGILNRSRHEIARVVRTSIAGTSDNVRQAVFAKNRAVVKGYMWSSTLDTRTCIPCADLDGMTFPVDPSGPRPPLHWQCRCSRTPVLKSWKEMGLPLKEAAPGTRASNAITLKEARRLRKLPKAERLAIQRKLQGQVPGTLRYPEWLKQQSTAVQDTVLGPTRAKLWRSGRYTIKEFTHNNRTLTLNELEALR
jgi:SPP1 gp7 family putative phage head morphogenesis protein